MNDLERIAGLLESALAEIEILSPRAMFQPGLPGSTWQCYDTAEIAEFARDLIDRLRTGRVASAPSNYEGPSLCGAVRRRGDYGYRDWIVCHHGRVGGLDSYAIALGEAFLIGSRQDWEPWQTAEMVADVTRCCRRAVAKMQATANEADHYGRRRGEPCIRGGKV